MTTSVTSPGVSRSRLWFGLLGGAISWLLHLIGASIISEWGCLAGLNRYELLGITAVAWMLIAISVVMTLVAVFATWFAYRVDRHYREIDSQHRGSEHDAEGHGTDIYIARVALWSSALFVFIILSQCVPIFYYLTQC